MRKIASRAGLQSVGDPLKGNHGLLAKPLSDGQFVGIAFAGLGEGGFSPAETLEFLDHDEMGFHFGSFLKLRTVVVLATFGGQLPEEFLPKVVVAKAPARTDGVEFFVEFRGTTGSGWKMQLYLDFPKSMTGIISGACLCSM